MKIFVVNDAGRQYDEVEQEFGGKVVFLTIGHVDIFSTDAVMNQMRRILEENNATEEDLLLVNSSIILVEYATIVFMEKFKKINNLIFNAKTKRFIRRDIDVKN